MDLNRKNNESDFDYIVRLVEGKSTGIYDIDYIELFKLAFGVELNSDECRKRYYGLKMLLPYLNKEKIDNISDDAILKEYELKKQEYQKEKIKVQTERIALSQLLREQARYELFTERAIQAIKEIKPLSFPSLISQTQNNIEGLLCIADCHFDKEIKIKGLKGEVLNEYNENIFQERMFKLLNKTIDICKKEKFTEIHIFNLGDELEGLIHMDQLMTLKYGVVESAIKYSYFIASWLNELSKYIRIKYYSTCGNHTELRLLSSKKGELPSENISKVIYTLTKEILKGNPNVECIENETDMIYVKIAGFNILGIHGEEKNIEQAIRDYSFIYNEDIDFIVMGHRHHANCLGISKGSIGVGSVCGLDNYSLKLKKIAEPSSTFVVFEENEGKTIEYNIRLN